MDYNLARNGQQLGVMSEAQVQQGLADGSVLPTDILWCEGMTDWKPVSEVFNANVAPPALPFVPVMTRPVAVPMSTSTPPASGLAITSLVMGILSFVTCGATGIIAIICGHIAKARINASGGTIGGAGMALAGLIMGYIGFFLIGFSVLAALALPAFNGIQQRAMLTKSISNARQIVLACKIYASDHEGKYPGDLDVLIKEGILSDERVLHDPLSKDASAIGYDYLGAGMKDNDPPDKILLQSKSLSMGKRVIGYNDASVQAVREKPAN